MAPAFLALAAVALFTTCPPSSSNRFSTGWKFTRGDGAWASPNFDASAWRTVNVPHDWSSEDLPPRDKDTSTPVIAVRAGQWKFAPVLGNASFADPNFDDSKWATVTTPADWHTYGVSRWNASGWYRRRVSVTSAQLAAARRGELRLALGAVASADVTYINGVKIGQTGTFFKQLSCVDALTYRSYSVAALATSLVAGDNLVAVNVWSMNGPVGSHGPFVYSKGALPAGGDVEPPLTMLVADALDKCNATVGCYGITYAAKKKRPSAPVKVFFKSERISNGQKGWHSYVVEMGQPGGLVDPPTPLGDGRVGPFDAGASPGQRQTGYTVGGVGWYRQAVATPPLSRATAAVSLLFEGCYMNCSGAQSHTFSNLLAPSSNLCSNRVEQCT